MTDICFCDAKGGFYYILNLKEQANYGTERMTYFGNIGPPELCLDRPVIRLLRNSSWNYCFLPLDCPLEQIG